MSPDTYPNLRFYIKSNRVANFVRVLKRPSSLTAIVALGIIFGAGPNYQIPLLVAFVVLATVFEIIRQRVLYGSKTREELFAIGLRDAAPHRIGRLLQSGKLEASIGSNGAALLEKCAFHFVTTQMEMARTAMFVTGHKPIMKLKIEVSESIDRAMKEAMSCFQFALMMPTPTPRNDLTRAQEIEQEMAKLEEEVLSWAESLRKAPEKVDLSPIRDQLQSMREFESSVRSGELRIGDVDLEGKARERHERNAGSGL